VIGLDQLCARLAIDPAAARAALDRSRHDDEPPWYVQLVLGLGAWITALAGLAFSAMFFIEVLGIEDPGLGVSLLGVLLFGLAYWLLWRRRPGEFVSQLLIATALCGAGLGVVGIGAETENLPLALLASLPFLAASILAGRSLLLQFLLCGFSIGLAVLWAFDDLPIAALDLMALSLPLGAFLMLRPPGRDVRPSALALVLALPAGIVLETIFFGPSSILGEASPANWLARFLCTATLAVLIAVNYRDRSLAQLSQPLLGAIAFLAILATGMLSPGLSSTLAVMGLGYTIGRPGLAALGAVGFGYFLWAFYVDLDRTLLTKSVILMLVGLLLLIARFAFARASIKGAPS
jgi:hypothetical protein